MMIGVGGTLYCCFRVAVGTWESGEDSEGGLQPIAVMFMWSWKCVRGGGETTAMVGSTHCRHVCAVAGRHRGRNDGRGGRYTLLLLLCGHGSKGGQRGQRGWV